MLIRGNTLLIRGNTRSLLGLYIYIYKKKKKKKHLLNYTNEKFFFSFFFIIIIIITIIRRKPNLELVHTNFKKLVSFPRESLLIITGKDISEDHGASLPLPFFFFSQALVNESFFW